MKRKVITITVAALLFIAGLFAAYAMEPPTSPVPRTINYDGTLEKSGTPATGEHDFRFQLINDGGVAVWPASGYAERTIDVVNGHFAVTFPDTGEGALGDAVFETRPLYLRISVKATSSGTYNLLDPAVKINAVPFAVRAEQAVEVDTVPTGMIAPFFGDTAPYGWLIADGSTINKSTTPKLSALVDHLRTMGPAYQGSTENEAVLPDLGGRFLRGKDIGQEDRNPDGGDKIGEVQEDELKSHGHSIPIFHEGTYIYFPGDTNRLVWGGNAYEYDNINGHTRSTGSETGTYPSGGSETRPKNVTVLHIIKW